MDVELARGNVSVGIQKETISPTELGKRDGRDEHEKQPSTPYTPQEASFSLETGRGGGDPDERLG